MQQLMNMDPNASYTWDFAKQRIIGDNDTGNVIASQIITWPWVPIIGTACGAIETTARIVAFVVTGIVWAGVKGIDSVVGRDYSQKIGAFNRKYFWEGTGASLCAMGFFASSVIPVIPTLVMRYIWRNSSPEATPFARSNERL